MTEPLAHVHRTGAARIARARRRLLVRGAVQGVGFRPFVFRCAQALHLDGWVRNTSQGVMLEAEGAHEALDRLIEMFRTAPPPNAAIDTIESCEIDARGECGFVIRESQSKGARGAAITPDIAICDDCLGELLDTGDRRHLYPFINCAHCGPRYTIVEAIPYDRARTSMRRFAMCGACRAEYDDPSSRRFHAEAIACPDCGPRLALWDGGGGALARDRPALLAAGAAVKEGRIVAVKGVGGFHLVCDACDEAAVQTLRQRKRREAKPFAVMFPDLSAIVANCRVSRAEEALLTSAARPIVLLRRVEGDVVKSVASDSPWLGALLPYSSLHHLLMREIGGPVVATSGNMSDEPIVTDEREALGRLAGVADLFLVHDRPIVRAVDDSVARVVHGRELILRRARGYAPAPINVTGVSEGILALGGHLKTTIALTRKDAVLSSQHIGDLDTAAAREAHARAIADMTALYDTQPRRAACDLHPDYASTGAATGIPANEVQHHLAHVISCMAENGIAPPVLGVAWDGAGFEPDGAIWGGEFLHVTRNGWRRVAHLRDFPLPGGGVAMREPRRAALGLLFEAFGADAFARADLAPMAAFSESERKTLCAMLTAAINAPRTTSAGRLFDAFASLTGLRQRASYEGQAAAELEGVADGGPMTRSYEFALKEKTDGALILDWLPALEATLADLRGGAAAGVISSALHLGLARAVAVIARRLGERRVVLTGGCFQNARLTEATIDALLAAGCEPIWHRRVPPNDGGIALGQAVWTAWCEGGEKTPCA